MRREIDSIDFGKWIKAKRKEKGWNQLQLARQIPRHPNSITRYETGDDFPPLDVAEKIVSLLGAELVIREKGNDEQ